VAAEVAAPEGKRRWCGGSRREEVVVDEELGGGRLVDEGAGGDGVAGRDG
jgi:hypothetical protein